MNTIIIQPKNRSELLLISSLLKKMNINSKVLSDEQKEDFGMVHFLKQADRSKKVSKASVMNKLKS